MTREQRVQRGRRAAMSKSRRQYLARIESEVITEKIQKQVEKLQRLGVNLARGAERAESVIQAPDEADLPEPPPYYPRR